LDIFQYVLLSLFNFNDFAKFHLEEYHL